MSVRRALIALALVTFAAAPSRAGHDAPELFELLWEVPGSELAAHAIPEHARAVALRPGVLGQSRFTFQLWEGESAVATRTRRVLRPGGSHTWIGSVDGFPGSHVSLTFHRGHIAGSIFFGERQFEVLTDPRGSFFFEIDTHQLPPTPAPVDPGLAGGDEGAPPTSAASWTHDLLVVYTPASRARYGQAGVETKILDAVASANQAYQNSLIDLQLSLVHMAEVSYGETGDMGLTLERLRQPNDGWMDGVHALRDQVGADLVALISEDTNYCGIAYVMTNESASFASAAFSVTYSGCLSNHTLAHEIGHNQGDAHDRANASVSGAFPYSYGYRRCTSDGTGFRTVMSYSCTGASRILHFSNPDVLHNGFATGIDHELDPQNSADNARSMTETADTIASFRDTVVSSPPATPTGLAATANSWDAIDLIWTDTSSDESGFRVERSLDGSSFSEIASLPADTSGYTDAGLAPNTSYWYRVSAYNGAGSSGYSNVDGATTFPPPPPPPAPSSLAAAPLSGSAIQLDWSDVAGEDGYDVERSPDGVAWSAAASVAADQITWTDTGLDPASTWFYRVRAFNPGGSSGPSNVASATTDSYIDVYAQTESSVHGNVSGSYVDTQGADGVPESVTETTTGGKPSRRRSRLEHAWSFDLPVSNAATFSVTAWRSGAGPDDFVFELSTDGGASWTPLLVVTDTTPLEQTALLPLGVAGPLEIRVVDTDRTAGETTLDTVHVDRLALRADFDPFAAPPPAPADVLAQALTSTHVAVTWSDLSGDELGFEIERSLDGVSWTALGTAPADATLHDDDSAAPSTTYEYRVRAFNGAGASSWVASAPVTTPGGVTLAASGYKVKGRQQVDLAWSGAAGTNVEIWRDAVLVTTVANTGSYTDAIGAKGGGSYLYQVCETGGGICSNTVVVSF